jgi:aminopeptidase-like protein
MKEIIETIYGFGATLVSPGYDNAIKWIDQLIGLDVIEIPSGTKIESWTVPDEWIVKDAWVKFNGQEIVNYHKNPLSLVVYSTPFKGKIDVKEFKKHLITDTERPDRTIYGYRFYEKDWGISLPYNQVVMLADGEYEVNIDTELRPGKMKIGVHTIKGKSNREILLFAHLDHPHQANDNLSGIACLVDLAKRIKSNHTIKIIFCPETIGSIAYATTQDISKVDFVMAVDICGNDNSVLVQKAFDRNARVNKAVSLAAAEIGDYRKADFRSVIGSDEYFFNDPLVGIPGVMLSTYPYAEYHTDADTPDKINYDKILETQKIIKRTIEIYEQDFIPERLAKGPIMRSKYGIQATEKKKNLGLDYFFYFMDGKRYLSELCLECGIGFKEALEFISKMEADGTIRRVNPSKKSVKQTTK